MLVRTSKTLHLEELIKRVYNPYSLRIVCYHSVASNHPFLPEHLCVSPDNFAEQMDCLKRHFNVVSFGELDSLRSNRVVRPLIITFDDGLRDNFDVAFPVLKEMGLKATFYLNTLPLAEGRLLWTHHLYALSKAVGLERMGREMVKGRGRDASAFESLPSLFRYVSTNYRYEEVLELLGRLEVNLRAEDIYIGGEEIGKLLDHGMEIGCHGHTHFSMTKMENAEAEARRSKECLEDVCRQKIETFAYPFGDPESFDDSLHEGLGNLFKSLCTTLPRINKQPWGRVYHRVCSYEMPGQKLLLKLLLGI